MPTLILLSAISLRKFQTFEVGRCAVHRTKYHRYCPRKDHDVHPNCANRMSLFSEPVHQKDTFYRLKFSTQQPEIAASHRL